MNVTRSTSMSILNRPELAAIIALILVIGGLSTPGITTDEPLDVGPGRHYWDVLARQGLNFFAEASVNDAFGGNPDHPPLARWLLGAASHGFQIFQVFFTGNADPTGLYILSGRVAPALAFVLTITLIARFVTARTSPLAGWTAALSYLFLPHVFAHGHLAALETILNLFWFAAVVGWLRWTEKPSIKRAVFATILTALTMLTKIHGWLLLPWAVILILFNGSGLKQRISGLATVALTPLLWFAGWPWMWYNTPSRLSAYFGGTVDRLHLKVLYFGQVYQDNQLPWHSSLIQFLAAITPFTMILLSAGLFATIRGEGIKGGRPVALLIGQMMLLFTLPITRYDMDRLFLVVWPLVAVLAGSGAQWISQIMRHKGFSTRVSTIVLGVGLVSSAWPCLVEVSPLSYVSPLAGGLRFFETQGMDLNFWGDAVDQALLRKLQDVRSKGEVVAVVPTLHSTQSLFFMPLESMKQGDLFRDQSAWRDAHFLVVYRRQSYWPDEFAEWIKTHEPISLRSRNGIWLAGIWPGPKLLRPISQVKTD